MGKAQVAILMGSDSDLEAFQVCIKTLEEFGIHHTMRILSAHRTPSAVADFVRRADRAGVKIFIAGAGLAAHLAGAVAAQTTKPVIGVPMASPLMNGLDALLSTVQMPGGVPVATVAVGKAGAVNAALLAVQILALSDARLEKALAAHKRKMADDVLAKDRSLRKPSAKR
jgi:phosphoribosylaminoimidazole carboxylase PurE protein